MGHTYYIPTKGTAHQEAHIMATTTTQTLTIDSIKRRGTSAMGNPSFTVTFTNGLVARTRDNAGIAYAIENSEYRGAPVQVTFTTAGTIINVQVAP